MRRARDLSQQPAAVHPALGVCVHNHRQTRKMNGRMDQELMEAANENNLPEVRRLLGAGADVNANDGIARTPLQRACYLGHVQVVVELLEQGADTEVKDYGGMTPLHRAVMNGHPAVVCELLSHSIDTTTILGKRKSRSGANVEARDNEGCTPLHFASWNGHLAIVQALLSGGADCRAVSNKGTRPIDHSVSFGNSAGAKCLLQHF
jgi:ankyrin repeat protein